MNVELWQRLIQFPLQIEESALGLVEDRQRCRTARRYQTYLDSFRKNFLLIISSSRRHRHQTAVVSSAPQWNAQCPGQDGNPRAGMSIVRTAPHGHASVDGSPRRSDRCAIPYSRQSSSERSERVTVSPTRRPAPRRQMAGCLATRARPCAPGGWQSRLSRYWTRGSGLFSCQLINVSNTLPRPDGLQFTDLDARSTSISKHPS